MKTVQTRRLEPDDIRIIRRVNGFNKQTGCYQQMYFKILRLIA